MDIQEVDKIILQNFKSLGWELDAEISNLQELDVSEMAKLMIKCLLVIDTQCDLPQSLPINMAQKFRCAAKIAEMIKSLGYNGDLGYQTILYPNEVDLRKLFMFLIEKIPKDSPTLIKEPQGKVTVLQREARKKINASLQRPWMPYHCIKVLRKYRNSRNRPSPPLVEYGIQHCHLFQSLPVDITNGIIREGAMTGTSFLPSLLNAHAEQLGKEMQSSLSKLDLKSDKKEVVIQEQEIQRNRVLLQSLVEDCKITHKWKEESSFHYLNTPMNAEESEKDHAELTCDPVQEKIILLQNTMVELQEKLQSKKCELEDKEEKVKSLLVMLQEEKKCLHSEEKILKTLQKTSNLAPNVDVNLEKLKIGLEANKEKDEKRYKQWEQYRAPLQAELEDLQFQVGQKKDKKKEMLGVISDLKHQMRSMAIESTKKEALLQQLRQQQEFLPKGVNRSVYTKQILDISSKVRKQKQEIEKVLRDTRLIQKEINNLSGKLQRTFAVAEDASFKAATTNEKSRPIYRAVISIHEECHRLVEIIRETGSIQREIADFQEQVNNENAKKIEENLKKIQEDLNKLKLENSVVKKRVSLNSNTNS